mmetsp:Transcript_20444/g.30964  ORF Transcript_20444/g.30964 Transcript_20444/m.30964 type:complete len:216 (+) Transcript_20444:890-1537(+)
MVEESYAREGEDVEGGADGDRGAEPFRSASPFQSVCGIGLANPSIIPIVRQINQYDLLYNNKHHGTQPRQMKIYPQKPRMVPHEHRPHHQQQINGMLRRPNLSIQRRTQIRRHGGKHEEQKRKERGTVHSRISRTLSVRSGEESIGRVAFDGILFGRFGNFRQVSLASIRPAFEYVFPDSGSFPNYVPPAILVAQYGWGEGILKCEGEENREDEE